MDGLVSMDGLGNVGLSTDSADGLGNVGLSTDSAGGLGNVGLSTDSADGLAFPNKMKTVWVIKYLNIYSTNK